MTLCLRVWNQKVWKCFLLEWNNLWEHINKMGPSKTKTNPQIILPSWPSWFNFNYPPNSLTSKFPSRPFFSGSNTLWQPKIAPLPTLRTLDRMSAKTWKALHLLLCWKGSLGFFKKRTLHTWCLIERKPNCVDCWFWPSWCSFLIFVDCWFFNQTRAISWSFLSWMDLVGDGEANWFVGSKNQKKQGQRCLCVTSIYLTFFFRLSLKKSGGCLRCACISLPKKELLCRSWGSSTVFWELGILQEKKRCGPLIFQTRPQKKLQVTSCWS